MKQYSETQRCGRCGALARAVRAALGLMLAAGLLLGASSARAQLVGENWTRLTGDAPWEHWPDSYAPRTAYRAVAFDNALWFYGNYEYLCSYDLWKSTDGVTWTHVLDHFPWGPYDCVRLAVFKGKLWAYSTAPGLSYLIDAGIWNSSDGKNWTKMASECPWSKDLGFSDTTGNNCAVLEFNGKLWFIGATANGQKLWWSEDGVNFQQVWFITGGTTATGIAPWAPRTDFSGAVVVFQNNLWVMGGYDLSGKNLADVWRSADGLTWTKVTDNAPWGPRSGHGAAVCEGKLWVCGGLTGDPLDGSNVRGVWCTADGVKWVRMPDAPWHWRVDPALVAFRDHLLVLGGLTNELNSEVWATPPPRITAPTFSRGTSATINWTTISWAASYSVQCDDAADFATPLKTVTVNASRCVFTGLQNERTYWYRVRLNRAAGQAPDAWSAPVFSIQDAAAPTGTVTQDLGDATAPGMRAMLKVTFLDPGIKRSGLAWMRVRVGDGAWGAWEGYHGTKSIGPLAPGSYPVQVQVRDLVGNVGQAEATAVIKTAGPIYVDLNNAAGPWDGTSAHPYKKIQDAVGKAPEGCEIVVAPGAYHENVKIDNKNLVLRSTNPGSEATVKATVINGDASGSVIWIYGQEICQGSRIEGFTITNGKAEAGGGINAGGTPIVIQNNRILKNVAYAYMPVSYPIGNSYYWAMIVYPRHFGYGGGIAHSNGVIQNNVIAFNVAGTSTPVQEQSSEHYHVYPPTYYYAGGALYDCNGVVRNNTLWENSITSPGLSAVHSCQGEIRNNIVWDKTATPFAGSSAPRYCDIRNWTGGGTGNLSLDPLLTNPAAGDFRPLAGSPCLDAGGLVAGPASDIVGTARPVRRLDPPRGDGSGFDIGAYEYPIPMVAAPVITMAPGTAAGTVKVTVSCPVAGAAIRSTWSGVEPTPASPLYTAPLILRGAPGTSITVKARAFKTGWSYSPVASKTYTFPGRTL